MQDEAISEKVESMLLKFKGQIVQDYISEIYPATKPPLWVILPPKEYTDIVTEGKTTIPSLLQLLEDEISFIRLAALMALTEITNKRFGSYEDFYNDERVNLVKRKKAANLWYEWWEENKAKSRVAWLIDDLEGNDKINKKNASIKLGYLGEKSAIPALKNSLGDPDLEFYVAGSLGRLEDKNSIPYLVRLYLTHDNVGYRHEGIEILHDLTKQTLGYNPDDPQDLRKATIRKWEEWWQKNKNVQRPK